MASRGRGDELVSSRIRLVLAMAGGPSSSAMREHLEATGHEVRVATPIDDLVSLVATARPDLVVLEAPHGEMESIALTIRRLQASCRPLILCALDGDANERAITLEGGADGYIERPFTPGELELHVRALLRRPLSLTSGVHRVGELVVDEHAHVVAVGDELVDLPAKEFELLALLASHAGVVLSKRQLLEAVWKHEAYDENLVEVHMSGLRRHLPQDGSRLIRTVRGVGYVVREDLPLNRLA